MKTEKDIIEDVKTGKASAFDALYRIYCDRLYSFAFSVLKSKEDAEEVVQSTFFKIWERRQSINNEYNFKSFLFTIAYNVTVDILRVRLKEKKYRDNILDKATSNYNLEEKIEFGDLLDCVQQIVKELPPRKKEIYQLSRVEQLSYKEIAERLGISVKTVENGINFSIKFIKSRLGKESLIVLCYTTLFL